MAIPTSQGGIDYPDGGFYSGQASFPMTGDLGELAARLGSVVTHNREGTILFIETFESGAAAWERTGYGAGAEGYISSLHYRSSGYSYKMIAGSDGGHAYIIFRKFPYPALGRYGYELSLLPGADFDRLLMVLYLYDGTYLHQFQLRYDDVTGKLQILGEDGALVDIATGLDLSFQYTGFHTFKLVADFATGEYVRAILNETEYNLEDYSRYRSASADAPNIHVGMQFTGSIGHNGYCWVDDIIVTRNEPEAR